MPMNTSRVTVEMTGAKRLGLDVEGPAMSSDSNLISELKQISLPLSTTFNVNPFSGSRVITSCRSDGPVFT
jgi:hypothetical protein